VCIQGVRRRRYAITTHINQVLSSCLSALRQIPSIKRSLLSHALNNLIIGLVHPQPAGLLQRRVCGPSSPRPSDSFQYTSRNCHLFLTSNVVHCKALQLSMLFYDTIHTIRYERGCCGIVIGCIFISMYSSLAYKPFCLSICACMENFHYI